MIRALRRDELRRVAAMAEEGLPSDAAREGEMRGRDREMECDA